MKERNVTVTLDKAREWFNSGNATLREVALQAFDKTELMPNFTDIKTFQDACKFLKLDYGIVLGIVNPIKQISRSSAAMSKLNIIRQALNFGHDLSLTRGPRDSYVHYPYNPLITNSSTFYDNDISLGNMELIGKIKSEGKEYKVLGSTAVDGGYVGLGVFYPGDGVAYADARVGFFGCATKEIAEHFGKYFGMLITEAKYADIISDFEIIESKYAI